MPNMYDRSSLTGIAHVQIFLQILVQKFEDECQLLLGMDHVV
jgi:hypothetical protein